MKDKRKRLPVAEQIRKGVEEAIRHAKGEITLRTTTLEMPDRPPEVSALELANLRLASGISQSVFARMLNVSTNLAEETARRQNDDEMQRGIRNRGEAVMSQATIAPPDIKTLADLRLLLGGIPLERIWFHPAPGTATEKDVIEAEARENRLCELVEGTLVEKAMGFEESRLAVKLAHLVESYLDHNDLGICVGADGMMRIAPGLVRIPDLSFISWDRLPGRESSREPIPDLCADLVVEVLSEGNTKPEMARKVREYFDAGVTLVWLIDPRKRTARVFSTIEKSVLVRAHQSLDGGAVLPGFVLRLSDLLDRGRRPRQG